MSVACRVPLIAGLVAVGLALGAKAGLAQSNSTARLSVESTLEFDFAQDDKDGPFGVHAVTEVERRLLAVPWRSLTRVSWRMQYLVLEVEIRRREEIGSVGVEGTVKATAWQYGPEAERKKLYTIETPGRNLYVDPPFVVTEEFTGYGSTDWRRFFFLHDGAAAFEGYGAPPRAVFTGTNEAPDGRSHRIAGFTQWDDKPVKGVDGGVVGLLTYMDSERVLARALLVYQDRKTAFGLTYVADERHSLDFVDLRDHVASPDLPLETPVWGQKLRLRFEGSNFDLYIPVKENGFAIDEPLQGLPPGFRLVPYTPEQRP